MAAKDFGAKHVCFKCSAKFYDLKKPEPICPKCGANQKDNQNKPEPKRSRLSAVPKIIEPLDPAPNAGGDGDSDDDEDSEEIDDDMDMDEEP
jgi:predicted  nucleic acid-binding Zn-ribbon protein